MPKPEIYVSIDVETDGPCPGLNSMLALGAAAFYPGERTERGTWYSTITPLLSARRDPDTMKWWETQPAGWKEVNQHRRSPHDAMTSFCCWVDALKAEGKPVAVGWPIAFDFAYVNYYCHQLAGSNPLGFAGLDIRSYANGLAGFSSYYSLPEGVIRSMADEIDTEGLRDHVALDDAIGQGRLFMALRAHSEQVNRERRTPLDSSKPT